MTGTLKQFCDALGQRESNGNYKSVNSHKYLGKYQMGEAALVDSGYYKKVFRIYNNDWTGRWTGKDSVCSINSFLNNKQAQENAIRTYMMIEWRYIKSSGLNQYLGKTINGVKITESGLIAGAHLKGINGEGGIKDYLKSNGRINPKDGYGTTVESYIRKFGGYDVSPVTKSHANSPKYMDKNGNRVFTREDLHNMSKEEQNANHDAIMKQASRGMNVA